MVKILLKAAVLFFIVISIYLIVNPSACSNMLAGRERVLPAPAAPAQDRVHPMSEQGQSLSAPSSAGEDSAPESYEGVFDTNSLDEMTPQPVYSQQDIDYAVASRYVELEREYAKEQPVGKDASREISFIVMDDFEMSPSEWEDFLSRATASDLFTKVRREMPQEPGSAE